MSYVNVEDGIYTGLQVHADPALRDLLQYVPKHRAPFTVIEVKGGSVVDEIRTKQSLVSFNKAKGSARQFLADSGIEVKEDAAPHQEPTGNKELDLLKAQNDELRALVEKLLDNQSKPAPAPVSEPNVVEPDDSKPQIPEWVELQRLDADELLSLAREYAEHIKGDIESMNVTQHRSWLNRVRKSLEG